MFLYLSVCNYNKLPELTEKELIKGCIKKDLKCQRLLFDRYAGKMMTVCLRYSCDQKEAEDILQESFIRMFSFIGQYRSEGSLEGWIKRIVVNCALRSLQNRKLRFVEITENLLENQPIDPNALTNLSVNELLKLIGSLPDGYRVVFNLHVMEGYDHSEIAEILHIRAATSRSQLLKARKLLQAKIQTLQKLPNGCI
jgi:RNA polymerase sigma factor (sigma-70 family)